MSDIDFGPQVAQIQADAINAAKADTPDFDVARQLLGAAGDIVAAGGNVLKTAIFNGRYINDLGVVSVREGLYARSHQNDKDALPCIEEGIDMIAASYELLSTTLTSKRAELAERQWLPGIHGHLCGTMNTWFRATQSAQLVAGKISRQQRATPEIARAQWMLGRGTLEQPGAWIHGRLSDNGYFSTQTAMLGLRGERINGGLTHLLKGVKWATVRGAPEIAKRVVTDSENRTQIILSAGRLSLESVTRRGAIAAALDYQRF